MMQSMGQMFPHQNQNGGFFNNFANQFANRMGGFGGGNGMGMPQQQNYGMQRSPVMGAMQRSGFNPQMNMQRGMPFQSGGFNPPGQMQSQVGMQKPQVMPQMAMQQNIGGPSQMLGSGINPNILRDMFTNPGNYSHLM